MLQILKKLYQVTQTQKFMNYYKNTQIKNGIKRIYLINYLRDSGFIIAS